MKYYLNAGSTLSRYVVAVLVVLITINELSASSDAAQILGKSPSGIITILRKHAGETGQYVEFLNTKTGKVAFSYRSTWRNTELLWGKSGGLLCINDEIATSGDFIYIFKIGTDGSITLLRSPSLDDFSSDLTEMLSKMPDPGRFTFIGEKWLQNNQLLASVSGGQYGESQFEVILQIAKDGGIEVLNPKLQH